MSNLGDALGHASTLPSSKSEEYYAWKLMAERLAVSGDDRYGTSAKEVLGSISQREAIKFQILKKLQGNDYNESSANYAQLQIKTGKNDKLGMAEFLTEEVFTKYKNRAILQNLIGSDADFAGVMADPKSAITGGGGLGGAIAGAFAALTGGRPVASGGGAPGS